MRSVKKLLAIGMVLVLVLAACSANDSGDEELAGLSSGGDSGSTATTMAGAGAGEAPVDARSGAESLGSGGIEPIALPIDFGRDIIFTAELVVAVSDVADAGAQATTTIQSLGGFLFGQQTFGSPNPTSVLTFKIAPENFQDALDRLGSIGEVRSQSVNANDVTERIVDLESRIATSSASVERLRALLSEANDIKSIVELEAELVTRETELETLRGSLRTLEDQVALATIVLSLTEAQANPAFDVAMTAYTGHDEGLSCPADFDLDVETGADATVCYELTNIGDTWLSGFEMRDPVLDIEFADLVVVFGDVASPLEPGDSIVLAAEVTPERDLRTRTTFTAQPVSDSGDPLSERTVSQTSSLFIDTIDPEGIASFSDGLTASWDLLLRLGQVLILVLGALLPFVWVPLVVWLFVRYRRKVELGA